MFKIKMAKFIISAVKPGQYPAEGLPEIALVGRSNVGKSSLINTIINRKNLARTSSQPGKTQTINFYLINDAWYFVDLPGYGFARVSHADRNSWKTMIESYLAQRAPLKEIWQLVDIRHPPTEQDKQMYDWISHYGFSKLIIVTKADKISKGQRVKHLSVIGKELGAKQEELVVFSAETREGHEELFNRLEAFIGCPGQNEEAGESINV